MSFIHRAMTELWIAVLQEHTYEYFWFPPVGIDALEAKWQAAPACGHRGIFDYLGGDWIRRDDLDGKERERIHYPVLGAAGVYTANICCDEDTYLICPDGRVLVHQGFDQAAAAGTDSDPVNVAMFIQRKRESAAGN